VSRIINILSWFWVSPQQTISSYGHIIIIPSQPVLALTPLCCVLGGKCILVVALNNNHSLNFRKYRPLILQVLVLILLALYSTTKTGRHHRAEILLKVVLSTMNKSITSTLSWAMLWISYCFMKWKGSWSSVLDQRADFGV
jgi:hypothetical protein